jgi:hypothetical protein
MLKYLCLRDIYRSLGLRAFYLRILSMRFLFVVISERIRGDDSVDIPKGGIELFVGVDHEHPN